MTDYYEYYKKAWEKQLSNVDKEAQEIGFMKAINALRKIDKVDPIISNSLADRLQEKKDEILK